MNTAMFYGGTALAVVFFFTSVFLFFNYKIPTVVSYLSRMKQKEGFSSTTTFSMSTANLTAQPTKTGGMKTEKPLTGNVTDGDLTEILSAFEENVTTFLENEDHTTVLTETIEGDKTELL